MMYISPSANQLLAGSLEHVITQTSCLIAVTIATIIVSVFDNAGDTIMVCVIIQDMRHRLHMDRKDGAINESSTFLSSLLAPLYGVVEQEHGQPIKYAPAQLQEAYYDEDFHGSANAGMDDSSEDDESSDSSWAGLTYNDCTR